MFPNKVQKQAYKNYLQEKRLYQEQLNEETRIRLERIKQASLALPEVVKTPVNSSGPASPTAKPSGTWLNYLTFGVLSSSAANKRD